MSNRGYANLHWPRCLVGLMLMLSCSSCATMHDFNAKSWATDYDTAERRIAINPKPLFIYYGDTLPTAHNPSIDWENDADLKPFLEKFVCCRLYRQSSFDRRYVAQYGVSRAPSVIVARLDGSHHVQEGVITVEQLKTFLAKANHPGQATTLDPHIVRRAHYEWVDNLATAKRLAQESRKPLLVAYVRRFSNDWSRINKLLKHHMVYRQLRDVVMCRIDVSGWSADVHISEFGVLTLPSIAIESPDGRHDILQRPTDYEAIAASAAKMHLVAQQVNIGSDVTGNSQTQP